MPVKNSLFHPDNWIWQPFGMVADFLILSCLWLICSAPLVTAGAATAALYDCCARCVKGEDRELLSRYFRTFRRELVAAIPSTLLWAAVLGGYLFQVNGFVGSASGTTVNLVIAYGMVVFLGFLVGVASWIFPLLSRFTFSFGALNRTAVQLALTQLPRTMALGVINTVAGWICLRLMLPVMVVPGIAALLCAYVIEPVFQTYETGNSGDNT